MDWVNFVIGICLQIIGFLWLIYQIQETKDYQKEQSYGQLSTQPSQYLGILICILGGFLMMYRAY